MPNYCIVCDEEFYEEISCQNCEETLCPNCDWEYYSERVCRNCIGDYL